MRSIPDSVMYEARDLGVYIVWTDDGEVFRTTDNDVATKEYYAVAKRLHPQSVQFVTPTAWRYIGRSRARLRTRGMRWRK